MAEPHPDSSRAEELLGHPVDVFVPAEDGRPAVAGSVAGDPPRARVAFLDLDEGRIVARVACPPGRPSRWRPVVASAVRLDAGGVRDRVLVARLAPQADALHAELATEDDEPVLIAGPGGLVIGRIPVEPPVVAVDALDARREPVGRLVRAGIAELQTDGRTVSGRLGASHGMAAGIGAGHWAEGLPDAAFEVGYAPWLPGWLPAGLSRGSPRIEPDVAYPAAPPALILFWTGDEGRRVLLRQAPAPLASPDAGGVNVRQVDVGGAAAALRRRGLVTLVWETPERAFGLQLRGLSDGEDLALRIARSLGPGNLPPA